MTDGGNAYVVTDYDDDGDDTEAIQTAIDAAHDDGGGTVHVPSGEYVTGTIELRSNVTVHLSAGSVVRGSTDGSDYGAGWNEDVPHRALLVARDAENVAITGRGVLDGSGTAFMDMDAVISPHDDMGVEAVNHDPRQGKDWLDPAYNTGDGPVDPHEDRPERMLLLYRCENVLLRDVTIRDSPNWTLHLLGCDDVDVTGIDMHNEITVPNSDGINPELSRNVHVSDCTIVTGDDAICPKATDSYPIEGVTENVTVTNCTLVSRSCAIKFGSATNYDIRDCVFENVVIRGSNRGLGIQHRDGGDVENVLFSNVTIETRLHTGNWWGKAEPIYVTSIPRREGGDLGAVRNVTFSNVTAVAEGGALVYGAEESTIENLTFDGVDLEIVDSEKSHLVGGNLDLRPTSAMTSVLEHDLPALYCRHVSDLDVWNLDVSWADDVPDYHTSAVRVERFADVTLDGVEGRQAGERGAAVELVDGQVATVRNCRASTGTDAFLDLSDVRDQRLLVANDFTDAETAVAGVASEFERSGNKSPQ